MKRFVILFLFFPSFICAQNTQSTQKIEFNKTAEFKCLYGFDNYKKLKAIRSSVQTLFGNFDICLIDANENDTFLDSIDVHNKDALLLTEYQLNRVLFITDGSIYLNNNFSPKALFSINGHGFKISDFNKNGEVYNATIEFIEGDVNWKLSRMEFYKKWMSRIIVDKLNPVEVLNLKTNKNQNIQDFLKEGNYLYVEFMASWCSPCFQVVQSIQKAKLPANINYLAVALESDKEDILQLFKTHEIDKWENVFIENETYEKMVKIGGIDFPFGILFNDKGEVVLYGASLFDLKTFFNIK